ncbi:histone-fold-containing protein [Artomyces pyxidatus]|uniref:Histone-fold-containing protein n=1 Tax=Artomyces pyxidatus TaxID=48021 RepID=A0ACB8SZP3_9AGAM|nr:histone-fold-containing protein [Artomyces pyxidatus]
MVDEDATLAAANPEPEPEVGEQQEAKGKGRPKGKAKPPTALVRESGKSVLPFSRVQKIMKADKELPMVAKEATFLISLATEEFIRRISEASQRVASREKRITVQQKDIASVVRKADEFLFLEEIIPWPDPTDVPARRKPQEKKKIQVEAGATMLDQYVTTNVGQAQDCDVIMNEDGTMQMEEDTKQT